MLSTTVKRYSLSVSSRLGLSRMMGESAWRRERLLVLCYHGISLGDEHEWNPELYVSQPFFERRLALIEKNRCTVLPLGEAAERLARNDLPERSVVLTFDDGYFDFLARAFPLLQAFGYPSTVYLPTMRCEHNFPVVSLFNAYLLWRARGGTIDGRGIPGLGSATFPLRTAAERAEVVRRVDEAIRGAAMTRAERDAVPHAVARALGLDAGELLRARLLTLMNPSEVAQVSDAGVAIELHTHVHRTPEDPAKFLWEIVENSKRIEKITGRRPAHFCYPSGVYRAQYLPILRAEGVVTATTCEPGLVEKTTNPLLMPRFVDTMGVSDAEFEGWLTGAASWLARAPRGAFFSSS
jgi:peptidoglycan/xylan/chitin deacetylase (PgdA/CDA1 family)